MMSVYDLTDLFNKTFDERSFLSKTIQLLLTQYPQIGETYLYIK